MKKATIIILGALMTLTASAQTINFIKGNVTYSYDASDAGKMIFSGETVTVGGREFPLSEWSLIKVGSESIEKGVVGIVYSGEIASVTVAGNIAPYIEVETDGAHVSITQSSDVSETTCGEITYSLSGETENGSLSLSGTYKSTIELQGLTLSNPSGAALDIQNGKRIAISAKKETVNYISDGSGSQKGAITCKGHLEFKGKGELNVHGNSSHAIHAKEYVEIKNLTLNISGSVKDGINCAQYFLLESGSVNITSPGDDGIQVSYKDDTDREAEDTGSIRITGGTLSIGISADAAKCMKADGDIEISEGTLRLSTTANGIWDDSKSKTKASACIGADGDVRISGGDIELTASGSGGKGISCDGFFYSEGGKLKIDTTGGMLVYSNGTLNHNYTGNTDRVNSDYKSSSKGIKADSGVDISGGEISITTATNNAEGIESKKELDIRGGTIFVKAYDDGINSSGDFRVQGGDLTVISIVGDGLDSNGNLTISGGTVRTMGGGGMEMGLDAATESGCAVYFTGGKLFSFGGSNTFPTKSGSTQAFVSCSGSITADRIIKVNSGDDTLVEFTVPTEYTNTTGTRGPGNGPGGGGWNPGGGSGNGSILISCPELISGSSYTIMNGTSSSTATARLTGQR